MNLLISDGASVTAAPCAPEELEVDDIVLVKVAGSGYLHKIIAIDAGQGRVLIGNNRGGVNGWSGFGKVAGLVTEVDGRARPRTAGKLRSDP